jgi:hypothetical protein
MNSYEFSWVVFFSALFIVHTLSFYSLGKALAELKFNSRKAEVSDDDWVIFAVVQFFWLSYLASIFSWLADKYVFFFGFISFMCGITLLIISLCANEIMDSEENRLKPFKLKMETYESVHLELEKSGILPDFYSLFLRMFKTTKAKMNFAVITASALYILYRANPRFDSSTIVLSVLVISLPFPYAVIHFTAKRNARRFLKTPKQERKINH